jgi:cytosolic carboxypeptidase protein 2/3|tara:strand:+ start:349 stop:573 length:225 start_codon:yes stop_codon:yes gene_type:complete
MTIKGKKVEEPRAFMGMNPKLDNAMNKNGSPSKSKYDLIFDSNFESGNLDRVYKVKDLEYDLFMRVDTNTSGHH